MEFHVDRFWGLELLTGLDMLGGGIIPFTTDVLLQGHTQGLKVVDTWLAKGFKEEVAT